MPAFTTHYLLIDSIKDKIQDCDKDLKLNDKALIFGAQGPDIFFCHEVWKTIWNGNNSFPLGSAMHSCESSRLFAVMKDYLLNSDCDKDIIKSYIYGFLSHYSLDRLSHPYIFSIQDKIIKQEHYEHFIPSSVHGYIESEIDTQMLKLEKGITDGRCFRGQDYISTDKHLVEELSKLMAYVVPRVLDFNYDIEQYRKAYRHTMLVQKLLYDPKGIKHNILMKLGTPIRNKIGPRITGMFKPEKSDERWDYMNNSHDEWSIVLDRKQKFNTSFKDLFDEAKIDTIELINAFNSDNTELAIKEIADDMSFDTGLRYDIKEPLEQ